MKSGTITRIYGFYHAQHVTLWSPLPTQTARAFDASPCVRGIRPTLESDFDYRAIAWEDR